MNATTKHTMENGSILQICLQCNLKVDAYGFPDPRFYDSTFMRWYYGVPQQDRCQHVRPAARGSSWNFRCHSYEQSVSEREKRFEKALYAALDLIKEALFARERA